MPLAAILLAAGGIVLARHLAVRAIERHATVGRLRVGVDGIIPGGETIDLPRDGAPAVLLLHGCGDTPQTLRYLAADLASRGYSVRAPLLPGHGRTLREFAATGADDWLEAARVELGAMQARHGDVALVGLSMGGALAAELAAGHPELPALVLAAPYLCMPDPLQRVLGAHRFWSALLPYVPGLGEASIRDVAEREHNLAYGYFTPKLLYELRRVVELGVAALPRITAPTLMLQSPEDNRVPAAAAQRAFDLIGAAEKHLVWTTGNSHVITVDFGRELVFEQIGGWLDRHLHHRPPRGGTG